MRFRLKKKMFIKGCIALLCGALVAILLLEIPTWPPSPSRHYSLIEAKQLLDITYEEVDAILKPYNLSVEITEENADKYGYDSWGTVALPDGGEFAIHLETGRTEKPYYWLRLDGPSYEEEADCVQWDALQYPFFYEIAASLCKNTYTAEQYKQYVDKFQNNIRAELSAEGESEYHEVELGGLLFKHGNVTYHTKLDDDEMYYSCVVIGMPLYIQL